MNYQERLLTPKEVADLFRVDIKTVGRWAKTGRLPFILTPGGFRRFPAWEVLRLRGEWQRQQES